MRPPSRYYMWILWTFAFRPARLALVELTASRYAIEVLRAVESWSIGTTSEAATELLDAVRRHATFIEGFRPSRRTPITVTVSGITVGSQQVLSPLWQNSGPDVEALLASLRDVERAAAALLGKAQPGADDLAAVNLALRTWVMAYKRLAEQVDPIMRAGAARRWQSGK